MSVFLKLLVALPIIPTLLCQECGNHVDIRPPIETFYSPKDDDGLYGNGWECSWKVSVDKTFRINLWFTTFQFDRSITGNCNDYLEMWDGSSTTAPQLFKSCAESLTWFKLIHGQNADFNSSGNALFLMMTTNNRDPRRSGFSATFRSIPGPATTTEAVVTTSPDKESTLPQRTTVDTESTTQVEVSATTPSSLFGLSTTVKSMPTSSAITLKSFPTDLSSVQPSTPPSSSWIFTVVVPTVSLVLLLICICVTGFFIYKRSSKGKHQSSPNNRSIHGVGTNPVTVVKEQNDLYNTTHCYVNESFHASPQGTYPPPYQSKDLVDDIRSSQMNTCIFSSEGVIGDVAYESFDGKEECNRDNTLNAEEVTNTAYESYDEAKIVDNGDYAQNVGEVENIAYESYDGEENVDNGVNTANIGEVSNIAYQSYDDQGKLENGDILSEGETLNVMYESYDRKENPGFSDDSTNGQVLNVAYESYDGGYDVTYDKDEDSMGYEAIDGSQSMDDEYSKIQ